MYFSDSFYMKLQRSGSRTPQPLQKVTEKTNTFIKIPRKTESPYDSKKESPRISFRVYQNFPKSTISMDKYSKPLKKGGKKLRKSLEKQHFGQTKNPFPFRNFISSTITPNHNTNHSTVFGQQNFKTDQIKIKNELKNFMFMYQIGFGGFGKVWKVQNRKTFQYFAMKEMEKRKVILKDSVACILNQLNLLKKLENPFIVNLQSAFQDDKKLYMIMDYLKGADLRYHICYKEKFTENQTKFIMACLILGIQYLHSQKVIHRDIKPENLVLEETGYVRLTDFGISKDQIEIKNQKKYDSSGTPGYMAPEMMERKPYSFSVDFFALGVIAFELMVGQRPYIGKTRQEIKQLILSHQVIIPQNQIPAGWSVQSADFINKLLERDPSERLGAFNGTKDLRKHKWMQSIDWKRLAKKQLKPPFIPNIVCETKEYLEEIHCYNQMNSMQSQEQKVPLCHSEQKLFENYISSPLQLALLRDVKRQKVKKVKKIL